MTKFDKMVGYENPLNIFRMCYAYFDNENMNDELTDVQRDFRFYGGVVCETIVSYMTHVIVYSK